MKKYFGDRVLDATKTGARAVLRSFGRDLVTYPSQDPLFRVSKALANLDLNHVIDVGANDGGFALNLRRLNFRGQIDSFEPARQAFERLSARTARDENWRAHNFALGAENSVMRLNLAANDEASSSFLPMLSRHQIAAPSARYVGTQDATVRKLDDVMSELPSTNSAIYLKIDVQGFERAVLAGARQVLASPRLVAIQLELSLVSLYEGSFLFREAIEEMSKNGFELRDLMPGFFDQDTGELLQVDGMFARMPSSKKVV